ncbi:hypothetical protein WMY93_020959 [Mugilogobius chulae]|uniref:Small nuclear ribonucleoprotein Sm D3 n=4 Tax=Percomorphaceae TaxID=1489872 RepID=A0AAW0NDV8_9GOBI
MGWNTGGNTTISSFCLHNISTNSSICPHGLTQCLFERVVTLHYMVFFNFFGCVLVPLVAMLVIYTNIFMAARRQLRLIGIKSAFPRACGEVAATSSKSTLQKEIHAAKSLAIIVGLFAFCWLPLHFINCFNHLCHSCERPHIWIMNIAIILSHANSAVNPFVYAYRIREFRHTFRRILSQQILGCRDRPEIDVRNGLNSENGCRPRSSSHLSKEGSSSCSTIVNSYATEPSAENIPPKAGQEGSNNWSLNTMSIFNVSKEHKVNTHVTQPCLKGQTEANEQTQQDLLNITDNGHNVTFVNFQAVTQYQTGLNIQKNYHEFLSKYLLCTFIFTPKGICLLYKHSKTAVTVEQKPPQFSPQLTTGVRRINKLLEHVYSFNSVLQSIKNHPESADFVCSEVLHEAEGHIVTCETNTGEVYRGKLIEAEDNMNCQMSNITVTYRDGRVAQLEQVYIRGSKIRFLILPDMLKNAPMLKSMKNKNQGSGAGRGKAAILKAQVAARGRGRGGIGRGNIFQKRR